MAEPRGFIASPSLDDLEKLNKEELVSIARALYLDFKRSMRKGEIKKLIVEIMVDDEKLPTEALGEYYEYTPALSESTITERLMREIFKNQTIGIGG